MDSKDPLADFFRANCRHGHCACADQLERLNKGWHPFEDEPPLFGRRPSVTIMVIMYEESVVINGDGIVVATTVTMMVLRAELIEPDGAAGAMADVADLLWRAQAGQRQSDMPVTAMDGGDPPWMGWMRPAAAGGIHSAFV